MNISLITDDESLLNTVRSSCPRPHHLAMFSWEGFLTPQHTVSEKGNEMLQHLRTSDAVLVEWRLENAPVFNMLCYQVRRGAGQKKTFAPVIAICETPQDEISALAAGADDAVTLPLILPVLQARIAATHRIANAVRRATAHRIQHQLEKAKQNAHAAGNEEPEQTDATPGMPADRDNPPVHSPPPSSDIIEPIENAVREELSLIDPDHDVVSLGPLRLDRTSYRFFVGVREIELMPKEFALLNYMMEHADEACTRDQILDDVWGIDFDTGTNMVDVYMHFLRKKLEASGLKNMLQTIRGRGYRLTLASTNAQ